MGTVPIIRYFSAVGRGFVNKKELSLPPIDYKSLNNSFPKISYKKMLPTAFSCPAARTKFHISASGELYPCPAMEYQDFLMGNVCNCEDFNKFIKYKQYMSSNGFINFSKLMPYNSDTCKNCEINLFCWQCPHYFLLCKKMNIITADMCAYQKKIINVW